MPEASVKYVFWLWNIWLNFGKIFLPSSLQKILYSSFFLFFRVICRFRPINDTEKLEGERPDAPKLEFPNDTTVTVISSKQPPQIFTFDKVFDWNSTQVHLFLFTFHWRLCSLFHQINHSFDSFIFKIIFSILEPQRSELVSLLYFCFPGTSL
jgi:hypothetical protein